MTFVYVDTETTGLDPDVHDVVEIAWAIEDGPIHTLRPWHTLQHADPKALEINGYFRRGLIDRLGNGEVTDLLREFIADLSGATIVGSNPAFDTSMLRRKFGIQHWHHRLFDVAAYGAGVLGWQRLRGLADISDALRNHGYQIGTPDHTARQDVLVLREVHLALLDLATHVPTTTT